MPLDDACLRVRSLRKVTLEFTTRCNLRCVYCSVPLPEHLKLDLDLARFDELVADLQALSVETVQISGVGETTIVKGWADCARRLQQAGLAVSLYSNLSKRYSSGEIDALARCVELTLSCDTVDPELFRSLRVGGDIALVFHNLVRIRAHALRESLPGPVILWNCVFSGAVAAGLPDWVAAGITLGVAQFHLSEMAEIADSSAPCPVHPLAALPPEELAEAAVRVETARRLAESAGRRFTIAPPVEEALRGRPHPLYTRIEYGPSAEKFTYLRDAGPVPPAAPGLTRYCLLPWQELFVWANRQVSPCCMFPGGVAPLASLPETVNAPPLVEIRRQLLTGQLAEPCSLCAFMELVEPAVLRAEVARLCEAYSGTIG